MQVYDPPELSVQFPPFRQGFGLQLAAVEAVVTTEPVAVVTTPPPPEAVVVAVVVPVTVTVTGAYVIVDI